jgi:hypothetical protein
MKKYSTCIVQCHVQFQVMREQKKIILFHQSAAQAMKNVLLLHILQ